MIKISNKLATIFATNLLFLMPQAIGIVRQLWSESPSISSRSLMISRQKLLKNAKKQYKIKVSSVILYEIASASGVAIKGNAMPQATQAVKIATTILPIKNCFFNHFEYENSNIDALV